MARWLGVAAGLCAIASAFAIFGFLISEDVAVAASNLLIIPAALVLGLSLAPRQPLVAMLATAAGIAASLMWAPAYRAASAEVWWIGLATLWWAGIGWLLLPRHKATGWLTLFLAFAAAVDLVVTGSNVGQPLFALGGLKIPLTAFWSGWIGVLLIREPELGQISVRPTRIQSAAALVGGAVWIAGGVGWLLTHGIQANVNEARLFGLRGTEYTELLAVAGLFWILSMLGARPGAGTSIALRASWGVATLGVGAVALGAFLETSVEDPVRMFSGLIVQSGWLLFIGGLVVMAIGMLAFGFTTSDPRLRWSYVAIGALAPMPVAAFVLGGLNSDGPAAILLLAILHAAPGVGFVALGVSLRTSSAAAQTQQAVNTPRGY